MWWHWSVDGSGWLKGPYCWSRPVAAGLVGLLARPLSENLVMDQSRGQARASSVASAGGRVWCLWRADLPRGGEFTVAARPLPEVTVPAASLRPTDGGSTLAPGSKRGASDRRH